MEILSKNRSLESSISKMKKVIDDIGLELSFSKELNPLNNCYSINLTYDKAPTHIYSNGKGSCSLATQASAYGELIERLQTRNYFSEFYIPDLSSSRGYTHFKDEKVFGLDEEYFDESIKKLYDTDEDISHEDFIDFNSDYEDRIISLPFTDISSNQTHYIPVNLLHNLYVSNGLATGNSKKEAIIQAICEIYERYVKIEIIKNNYSLPEFPNDIISAYPKLSEDISSLKSTGYIIKALDASLGGRFPVTAISLINPTKGTIYVSFGSHPILEVSLERTMTELMQGRDLDTLDSFERPTFDMDLVNTHSNIESHFIDSNGKIGFGFLSSKKSFEYTKYDNTLNNTENINDEDEQYKYLLNIAHNMDKKVLIRSYDYLGFDSVQVIIPTISEIYPIQDLIYNNANEGKKLRKIVLGFEDILNDTEDTIQNILDEIEYLENSIAVDKYIGVIFEHSFDMAKFKAQLNLSLGDYDRALELLDTQDDTISYIVSELIKMYIQQIDWQEYEKSLFEVFSKEKVETALSIFNGDDYLIDVAYAKEYLNILDISHL
jgi:ribosomal protein S12 methylthiotransferase accessory factor